MKKSKIKQNVYVTNVGTVFDPTEVIFIVADPGADPSEENTLPEYNFNMLSVHKQDYFWENIRKGKHQKYNGPYSYKLEDFKNYHNEEDYLWLKESYES